ncbi:MAG: hypothetical protein CVU44_02860 [Chloroflexi bacterium HGW-Chloroflexi-6]|nr:MAG: hypothetical protein CVU44_02860 [Chloroflexi bacterium HGW-Chloroflexi-6]
MLSNFSRWLTYSMALLYGILGVALFFLPEQLAPLFAWKVTAFMTMTIGGWCLGNAWLAFISARRWEWELVYPSLIYLWLFGLAEILVLFFFRDKLNLEHPIAWLYLVTLVLNILTAVVGVFDWLRIRPAHVLSGQALTPAQRWPAFAFVLLVGFLGLYGLIAQIGAPGTNGGIFPEKMSLFTLRSFGAFYLCLALGVVPLFWEKNLRTVLHQAFAAYGLVFFITIAAFAYLRLFDFAARPGGLAYFGAYLVVGIPLIFVFRKYGTGG